MKIYDSLVEKDLIREFPSYYDGLETYENYVANHVDLEKLLACAAFFTPPVLEYNNRIYLRNNINLNQSIEYCLSQAGKIVGSSEQEIQKYLNLFELSGFYLLANTEALDNNNLFDKFSETIIYFWQQRLNNLFPERTFKFLLGENILGEEGLSITFFEDS